MLFNIPTIFGAQFRTYATLKDIQMRLKSIKNIGKITKSMKMIASTKLNRAQKAMEAGRLYGQTATGLLNHVKVEESKPEKQLIIACSSDRGLCGAIHSSVSKMAKKMAEDASIQTGIIVLGDKSKPQIARGYRRNIQMSFNQVGKDIPTMTDAITIAQLVLQQQEQAKESGSTGNAEVSVQPAVKTRVIYNKFVSAIAYDTTTLPIYSAQEIASSPSITAYEYEDATLEAYSQFMMASQIFWGLVEGHASEMSAKRTAMENASKNSDAIVLNLTMQYNRTRQAVITNELVDIITGASAL